ncbi:MAG TPA: hypothetical protein VH054_04035, partial [Polyangiaceae bacterium]|nr:hypothetical protein [Polyangiaceae bacterium]
MKRIAVALFLVACSRSRHETTLTSATLDAAASQRDLVNLAEQWDRALALRDPSLVARVYADRVAFYGIPLRHDQVVSVQAFAIDADPSFTQRITKTRVDGTRVAIDREWVRFGKQHTGHMWLTGAVEHGHWVVTSVGDDASDARARPAPPAAAQSCEATATRVALSTREGNALVEGPPDHVNVRIAATPPSFPAYAVAMTTMAAGVPTTVAWY